MVVEVVVYGVALVWLVGLLPAAVITCMKGQWAMFAAGWLTLGLVWFIGALGLARTGSVWARHFYAAEKLAQIADQGRRRRPWRGIGITAALSFGAILLFGLLGARPAPLLGLDGDALESSVGGEGWFGAPRTCTPIHGGDWTCTRWDDGYSSTIGYRVEVNGLGCWHAVREGPEPGEGAAKRLYGCVHLDNYR